MPSKTANLQLNVDYDTNTKVAEWRAGIDSNFVKIDQSYGQILTNIDTAIDNTSVWEKKVENIVALNKELHSALADKMDTQTGKSLVDITLIEKLADDYTKEEIDATFVTKEVLSNTTIKKEDINLENYYTKSEVNSIVIGGSSEALKDYYTKEEIENMLAGDADIKKLIDYLEVLNGYELSLKELEQLNGIGGE